MEDISEFTDAPGQDSLPATLSAGARAFIKEYAPQDDDSGCVVSFETVREFKPFLTRQAQEKAEAEGRTPGPECEVFGEETFIRINIRGNDKIEVHRPVRDEDKRRFPYAWQEYKRGSQHQQRGTPLARLGIDSSVVRQYHARNVWTVEDLAQVNDNNLQNLGTNAREFRRAAQEFLQSAPSASSQAMQAQIDSLSEKLAKAMQLIEQQSEQLAKRAPGKPPKQE